MSGASCHLKVTLQSGHTFPLEPLFFGHPFSSLKFLVEKEERLNDRLGSNFTQTWLDDVLKKKRFT